MNDDLENLNTVRELETIWDTLGITEADLMPQSNGTIRPHHLATPEVDWTALDTDQPTEKRPYQLHETLGEGGMGLVRLATQTSMKRTIAVKTLREDVVAPQAGEALVREAWIMGMLEHPNIVPIHTIWHDSGAPMIAMKRIEGMSWGDILRDPALYQRLGVTEPLEWHLNVLMEVCRAVHFAHSRGVIHRDIKPDNVMIGSFGEVYVVDWGIAVSVESERPDWIPFAGDVSVVAGTPEYMAPEMAAGDGGRFGPVTDVYLLGATLCEVLTGKTRHAGKTPREVLTRAYVSKPVSFAGNKPAELCEIVNRATAREPENRYRSADELRAAIAEFLKHQSSAELTEAAASQLAELQGMLRRPREDDTKSTTQRQRLVDECGFALKQAAELWPDNPKVTDARQSLLTMMAERALSERQLDKARQHIRELSAPSPKLIEQLKQLEHDLAEEARLQQIGKAADLNADRKNRSRLIFGAGLAWLVGNLIAGLLTRSGVHPIGYTELLIINPCCLLVGLVTVYLLRDSLWASPPTRRVALSLLALFPLAEWFWLATLRFGVPFEESLPLSTIIYIYYVVMQSILLDKRIIGCAIIMVLVGGVILIFPAYSFDLLGLGGCLSAIYAGLVWKRVAERPTLSAG